MTQEKYLFVGATCLLEEGAGLECLAAHSLPGLLELEKIGYRLVLVGKTNAKLVPFLKDQGIHFFEVLDEPISGEVARRYLSGGDLDFERSRAVGCEWAESMGIAAGDLRGGWPRLAKRLAAQPRVGAVTRKTKETAISAEVRLDGGAAAHVKTGIGFFDHMLEQIAKHGGFTLTVATEGDLHVDEHHTVEDTAIVIGQAMSQALGDKRGIQRYGFLLPMDETEAKVSLDLSGRAYSVFEGVFPRGAVGELSTEMVPHFFRSFAEALGATLHITVKGENTHHMVESTFKGVGRALRMAIQDTGTSELPSTKGVL